MSFLLTVNISIHPKLSKIILGMSAEYQEIKQISRFQGLLNLENIPLIEYNYTRSGGMPNVRWKG